MSFHDPQWRDTQAGEYVLGTLPADEHRQFERELETDRNLQDLVTDWQERLQPLADAIPAAQPHPQVWQRIVDSIQLDENLRNQNLLRLHERQLTEKLQRQHRQETMTWKFFTTVATAASLVLGLALWQQPVSTPPQYDAVSVITADDSDATWVVDASLRDKKIRITSIAPPALDDDQVHQLWMVRPDQQGVVSLGLLPRTGNTAIVLDAFSIDGNAIALAISLEPAGGSRLAGPSGPVLYQGVLTRLEQPESF